MPQRNLTVYAGSRKNTYTPQIILQGNWLKNLGFDIGDKINMDKESLLEVLLDERMGEALEQSLETNTSYIESKKEMKKQSKKLDKIKLSKKQRMAFDDLFSAYNFNLSEYGRAAYMQGFKDCMLLMQEIYNLTNEI